MEKLDYKKAYRDLYLPPQRPVVVQVPQMRFLMMDGTGAPESAAYQNAVAALYAASFAIKMSKQTDRRIEGYFEYVVPPLEGLWWWEREAAGVAAVPREQWHWTAMIRQPEFVTDAVFGWALETCRRKKPEISFDGLRLEDFTEGLCVQQMHLGPFATEEETLRQMHCFLTENRLADGTGTERKHHEIYLGDPRRTKPERMKTVLRLPVRKIE